MSKAAGTITYRGILNDQLGPLPVGLRGHGRREASHRHVRSASRAEHAPHPPVLGRARLQGHVPGTTMMVPEDVAVFSNTAEVAREQSDGRTKISFATSMKMSTYLLAFHQDRSRPPPVVVRGTPIRIVVPRGNLHRTDVAMENAIFSSTVSDYFGMPYPANSSTASAVPDFAVAMETSVASRSVPRDRCSSANRGRSRLQTSRSTSSRTRSRTGRSATW